MTHSFLYAEDRIDELGLTAMRVAALPPKVLRDPRNLRVLLECKELIDRAVVTAQGDVEHG